jgi:hypothetical protein
MGWDLMTATESKPRTAHPAAAVWPLMPGEELDALADDITANGLLHPIVLTVDGQILDGRNRLEACARAGVDPEFVVHDGDPVAYVLGANLHRRHISKGQLAMAAVLTSGPVNDLPVRVAASQAGTTHPMIVWARTIARHAPSLAERVLAQVDPLPLRQAYDEAVRIREVAAMPDPARIEALPDDLAALVRGDVLTLAGAEAEHAERERKAADRAAAVEQTNEKATAVVRSAVEFLANPALADVLAERLQKRQPPPSREVMAAAVVTLTALLEATK